MLCTIAPRTVASLELRVFSVTARQCVKVLSDSSYSLRWKSAFASESSCSGAGRGHGERQPGDAEGPGGCEGEREAEGRKGRGHKARWHATCHSRLCSVSLFTLAPICAW